MGHAPSLLSILPASPVPYDMLSATCDIIFKRQAEKAISKNQTRIPKEFQKHNLTEKSRRIHKRWPQLVETA